MHLHDLNRLIFYRENCKAMLKFSLVGDLPYFSLLKNGIKMKFLILIAVPKCLTKIPFDWYSISQCYDNFLI